MVNRVHVPSRWPVDPRARIRLARVDQDFCAVMHAIVGDEFWTEATKDLLVKAMEVIQAAHEEINNGK